MQGQLSWDLSGMNQMFPEGALTRLHALFFQMRKKKKKEIDLDPKANDMIFKERKQGLGSTWGTF